MDLNRWIDEFRRDLSPLQGDLLAFLLAGEEADDEAVGARHGVDGITVRRERVRLRLRLKSRYEDRKPSLTHP